jgi:chaperonin GroES
MNIKPLGNRVILELTEIQQTTESGLIIPDSVKDEPTEGTVVALGDTVDQQGNPITYSVKVGDRVMFPMYTGLKLTDYPNHRMFNSSDLLGILK